MKVIGGFARTLWLFFLLTFLGLGFTAAIERRPEKYAVIINHPDMKEGAYTLKGNLESRYPPWRVSVYTETSFMIPKKESPLTPALRRLELAQPGDEVLIYIDVHGDIKKGDQTTHTVQLSKEVDSTLDLLKDPIKIATAKGVKVALVDQSCFSQPVQRLSETGACIITSGNKGAVAVSVKNVADTPSSSPLAFSNLFVNSPLLKNNNPISIEQVYLSSRERDFFGNFPRISSDRYFIESTWDRFFMSYDFNFYRQKQAQELALRITRIEDWKRLQEHLPDPVLMAKQYLGEAKVCYLYETVEKEMQQMVSKLLTAMDRQKDRALIQEIESLPQLIAGYAQEFSTLNALVNDFNERLALAAVAYESLPAKQKTDKTEGEKLGAIMVRNPKLFQDQADLFTRQMTLGRKLTQIMKVERALYNHFWKNTEKERKAKPNPCQSFVF